MPVISTQPTSVKFKTAQKTKLTLNLRPQCNVPGLVELLSLLTQAQSHTKATTFTWRTEYVEWHGTVCSWQHPVAIISHVQKEKEDLPILIISLRKKKSINKYRHMCNAVTIHSSYTRNPTSTKLSERLISRYKEREEERKSSSNIHSV